MYLPDLRHLPGPGPIPLVGGQVLAGEQIAVEALVEESEQGIGIPLVAQYRGEVRVSASQPPLFMEAQQERLIEGRPALRVLALEQELDKDQARKQIMNGVRGERRSYRIALGELVADRFEILQQGGIRPPITPKAVRVPTCKRILGEIDPMQGGGGSLDGGLGEVDAFLNQLGLDGLFYFFSGGSQQVKSRNRCGSETTRDGAWLKFQASRCSSRKVAEGTARGNSQTIARIGCVLGEPRSLANTPMFISAPPGRSWMRV